MNGVAAKPEQKHRVIRVFISSTFRDMKDEREELVKRVFPQLRKICEKRGVVWGEVDLRWGITDEQRAEGKVLPICLQEINECIPYFIGILGERYGWLPDEIPRELIQREPWLEEHKGKSVTELEILHGVLNNPGMADHSYFYFRDPAYVESMHEEMHADYPGKLASLKDRIRSSGLPVRENYANPKELGELVLKDLTAVIDKRFPKGTDPDPLDREAIEHEVFAQAKKRIYIERIEYFNRLDKHAEGNDQPLVVLGESGMGKSALLANWVLKYRDEHPENLCIMHFIGSTPYSSDWAAMLRRIMGEFKRRFDIVGEFPSEPGKLRSAFANWLHIASTAVEKEGAKIILILDALNQLEDRDNAPDLVWLPTFIPENIRLVLSTLPGRPLDDLSKREWSTMVVEPLKDDERKRLITGYLAQYRKTLSEKRVEKIASAVQTCNPLYLRALLEELRVTGEYERLDELLDHYLEAKNVPEIYQKIFERYEVDYERDRPGLIRDTMTLLWASRRGLSETELLDLLGEDGEPLPHAFWAPFFIAADNLFVSRSGLIGFSHDYKRQAIEDRYLQNEDEKNSVHIRLADYFSKQELNPRVVDELPWQLSVAESWQRLYDLLADLDFLIAAWVKDEFDVKSYWTKVVNSTALSLVDAYHVAIDTPDVVSDTEVIKILSSLLLDMAYQSEALLLLKYLTAFYHKTGDKIKLAESLNGQGIILWRRRELESAMDIYKEVERIGREDSNESVLAKSLNNQGMIHMISGDLAKAMALFRESEEILRVLDDKHSLSASLCNQGDILWRKGDLGGAMALYKEDEKISREIGNKNGLSSCLINQGVILKDRGDLDGAMKLFKEQERICRDLGDKPGLSMSFGNQGIILRMRGDLDSAMRLYKKDEQICIELGDKYGLAVSLGNQGFILRESGDLEDAHSLYLKSEQIFRELGDKHGLSYNLNNQAAVLKELGMHDKAINLLRESESMCREVGIMEYLAESLAEQADVLMRINRLDEALPLVKKAHEIATAYGYAEQIESSKSILDNIHTQINQTDSS